MRPLTKSMSLEEIGDELGVTRERARQIEASALAKLRKALKARGLTFEALFVDTTVESPAAAMQNTGEPFR